MRVFFILIFVTFSLFFHAQDKNEELKYYDSGNIKASRIHKENHEKCKYTYFYENGNIKTQGYNYEYKKDGKKKLKKVGIWTYFYEDSNKKSEGKYGKGEKYRGMELLL